VIANLDIGYTFSAVPVPTPTPDPGCQGTVPSLGAEEPGYDLSGRVTLRSGEPLAGVCLVLKAIFPERGSHAPNSPGSVAVRSDGQGNYVMRVAVGVEKAVLKAEKKGYRFMPKSYRLRKIKGHRRNLDFLARRKAG
jgi:hypothetical protein